MANSASRTYDPSAIADAAARGREHDDAREAAQKYSVAFTTLAAMLVAIVLVLGLLYIAIGADMSATVEVGQVYARGLAMAVVIPALIAPPLAYRTSGLLRKLRRAHDQLEDIARRDPLTGLLNRRGFQTAAAAELGRGGPVGVLLGDIDRFKAINDTHGHDAGDLALIHIARILRESVRAPGAAVGRYGGEEFAILLPGHSLAETQAVAEALRAACEANPLPLKAASLSVTLSIGATARSSGPVDLELLLSEADKGLYQAKLTGRNRVVVAVAAGGNLSPPAELPLPCNRSGE